MIVPTFTIDRTSLSLDPLELTEDNGYILDRDNFGLAGQSWDKGYVSAPDYDGDRLVRARKTNSTWQVQVRVTGSDAADAKAKKDALLAAVSQINYTVTIGIDGVGEVWTADPADWQIGGELMLDTVERYIWQVVLTIPVYPIPVAV